MKTRREAHVVSPSLIFIYYFILLNLLFMKKNTLIAGFLVVGMGFGVMASGVGAMDLASLTAEQKVKLEAAMKTQDPAMIKATMEGFGFEMPSVEDMQEKKDGEPKGELKGEMKGEVKANMPMKIDGEHKDEMGFGKLTDLQKQKLQDLRAMGNKEALLNAMKEFGVPLKTADELEIIKAERKEKMIEVKSAIKENNYDDFVEAVQGTPFADKLDQATFETLVKAEELREEGKYNDAALLVKGLGMGMMHKEFNKKFVRQNLSAEDKELAQKAKELIQTGDVVGAQEIFSDLKEKYAAELLIAPKRFSLFGWLKKAR